MNHLQSYNDENARINPNILKNNTTGTSLFGNGTGLGVPKLNIAQAKQFMFTDASGLKDVSTGTTLQKPLAPRAPLGQLNLNQVANKPTTSILSNPLLKPSMVKSTSTAPTGLGLKQPTTMTDTKVLNISVDESEDEEITESIMLSPRIDAADLMDPQTAAEFVKDIYDHLKKVESDFVPSVDYFSKQIDINSSMRSIMVDYLINLSFSFKLSQETLYLCINILDRFLANKVIGRKTLQLAGLTCLFIASKYEEILPPSLESFLNVCADSTYKKEDMLKMEGLILSTLDFALTVPTSFQFLRRYLKVSGGDLRLYVLSYFLLELTMIDHAYLQFKPSLLASSVIYLSRKLCRVTEPIWTKELQYYTQFEEDELVACKDYILTSLRREPKLKLQSLRKKYGSTKRLEIAKHAQVYLNSFKEGEL